MTKVSTLTAHSPLIADDISYVVDSVTGTSKKLLESTRYTFLLASLTTANKLVPTLTADPSDYLAGDGTFKSMFSTLKAAVGDDPSFTVTTTGTTSGNFTLGTNKTANVVLTKQLSDSGSNTVVQGQLYAMVDLSLTGHTSGTITCTLSVDLSAMGVTVTSSTTIDNNVYFPVVIKQNKVAYAALAKIAGPLLTIEDVNVGITGDGDYALVLAGQFLYYTA